VGRHGLPSRRTRPYTTGEIRPPEQEGGRFAIAAFPIRSPSTWRADSLKHAGMIGPTEGPRPLPADRASARACARLGTFRPVPPLTYYGVDGGAEDETRGGFLRLEWVRALQDGFLAP